jgi:hypothetical protein
LVPKTLTTDMKCLEKTIENHSDHDHSFVGALQDALSLG